MHIMGHFSINDLNIKKNLIFLNKIVYCTELLRTFFPKKKKFKENVLITIKYITFNKKQSLSKAMTSCCSN